MIHIFIEQAKSIKIDTDDSIDTLVEIKCFNMRKYTTVSEEVTSAGLAIWNEHIFFEPKNVEVNDLKQAKIEIKLLNKGFFKNVVIGYYEFDLGYLYR